MDYKLVENLINVSRETLGEGLFKEITPEDRKDRKYKRVEELRSMPISFEFIDKAWEIVKYNDDNWAILDVIKKAKPQIPDDDIVYMLVKYGSRNQDKYNEESIEFKNRWAKYNQVQEGLFNPITPTDMSRRAKTAPAFSIENFYHKYRQDTTVWPPKYSRDEESAEIILDTYDTLFFTDYGREMSEEEHTQLRDMVHKEVMGG
jgi:hypothetical protein